MNAPFIVTQIEYTNMWNIPVLDRSFNYFEFSSIVMHTRSWEHYYWGYGSSESDQKLIIVTCLVLGNMKDELCVKEKLAIFIKDKIIAKVQGRTSLRLILLTQSLSSLALSHSWTSKKSAIWSKKECSKVPLVRQRMFNLALQRGGWEKLARWLPHF